MVKPKKKLKKILLMIGVTGGIYLVFKYILPLVIPFFIAGVVAVLLYPSAVLLSTRLSFQMRGRRFKIPVCLIGILELLLFLTAVGIWLWAGGQRLYREGRLLLTRLPEWLEHLDIWLTGLCYNIEETFELQAGVLVHICRDMIRSLATKLKDGIMPYLMSNSVTIFSIMVGSGVMLIIMILAVALFLQEMPDIRRWCRRSPFRSELRLIRDRLALLGKVYIKAQGMILLITTSICIFGLFIMGNPYSILLGIVIGILDALPVLGTGSVFIPWILVSLFTKQWKRALLLLAIYLICYFLRQYLEARLIGKQVGLSPLVTLVTIFAGLQLFGLTGVILGPIGLMLVLDFTASIEEGWDRKTDT